MSAEDIVFDWDDPDRPHGNWQHIFEGHDVEPEEVEEFVLRYWMVPGACVRRPDESFTVVGTGSSGRTLFAAFRMIDKPSGRLRVITCFPLEDR